MTKPNFDKVIGLALNVQGVYEPSNGKSAAKLMTLYAAANVPRPWCLAVRRDELSFLRDLARAAGWRIMTTAGRTVRA